MTTCPGNCARCTLPSCSRRSSSPSTSKGRSHRRHGPCPPVPRDEYLLYAYDGTLEGFFSAVFTAYAEHAHPTDIVTEDCLQLGLMQDLHRIATDEMHAIRVRDGIIAKLGRDEYERLKVGFLSDAPDKGGIVYRYIVYSLHAGSWAAADHTHPDVVDFDRIWRQVYNERHRILQFARFSQMEGGVFFAKVNPNANVVPLVMDHFAGRFNTQPFLIYDEVHHLAGIQRDGAWRLVPTASIDAGTFAADEVDIRDMWKRFYDAICNEERLNPRLRMGFMPKRLWGNMVEMDPLASRDIRREYGLEDTGTEGSSTEHGPGEADGHVLDIPVAPDGAADGGTALIDPDRTAGLSACRVSPVSAPWGPRAPRTRGSRSSSR